MRNASALINGIVYTGRSILHGQAVLIENGKITGLAAQNHVPKGRKIIDLDGGIVAPGFIDAHVNGGGGVLFTADPAEETLRTIGKAHERYGTLHWCPTVLTSDIETTKLCLRTVKAAVGTVDGVLGAHLEGPYLSKVKRGIHDKRFIRPADDGEIVDLLEAGEGAISLVTLAPEAAGELHIFRFIDAGARVFLGHTDAPCVVAEAAFTAGVCGVTHLYNAMSQLTGREPGVVGAAFAAKEVWAAVIADGFHADWRSVQIAKEIKKDRLFLTTDAMPPVGKPDAVFVIGGNEIAVKDGRCATADGTLVGSALDMAGAVRNCVKHCGIAPDEALRMASAYPAEMLGIGNRLGYIGPGYAADLVFLSGDLYVTGVMRGGEKTDYNR